MKNHWLKANRTRDLPKPPLDGNRIRDVPRDEVRYIEYVYAKIPNTDQWDAFAQIEFTDGEPSTSDLLQILDESGAEWKHYASVTMSERFTEAWVDKEDALTTFRGDTLYMDVIEQIEYWGIVRVSHLDLGMSGNVRIYKSPNSCSVSTPLVVNKTKFQIPADASVKLEREKRKNVAEV
jgi:hypothetical protein